MDGRGYRTRSARVDIQLDAILTEPDGCCVPVVITDVSKDGFRLQSRAELVIGDEVTLQVQKRPPVRGRIQWTCGLEAGGTFLEPVAL